MNAAVSIAGLLAVTLTSTAFGQSIRFADGPGTSSGGEFRARISGLTPIFAAANLPGSPVTTSGFNGAPTSEFVTFCLELSEEIRFDRVYSYTIGSAAVAGGGGATGGSDPLSLRTQFLYSQFARGTLTSYAFSGTLQIDIDPTSNVNLQTYTRENSANALQRVFWNLENEVTGSGSLAGVELALYNLWTSDAAFAGVSGVDYGVRVVNPTENGALRQSMLILIPLPPAAWAGVGTLAGLALFGAVRRRNNERAGV